MDQVVLLALLIFAAAILYSSVGHAGASGYLAAMALVGVAPDVMKPTALALNILVASIATTRYYRAGYFSWSALWPFAFGSIPLSFVGGAITLPGYLYKLAVGLVQFYAAYRLFRSTMSGTQEVTDKGINIPTLPAVAWGAAIGLRDFEVCLVNRPSGAEESRAALAGIQVIASPSLCSPERLFTSSTSRCLRPDSRARIIPSAEPQITMPDGIATARSGIFVTSWYM